LPSIYSSKEIQNLLKADSKVEIFYKYWTRKEAILKSIGIGINNNLSEIIVMDGYHTVKPKLLGDMKYLNVLSFALDKNYIASITVSDKNWNFDKLLIYNLPTPLERLLSFCS
jgi:4'-phosphopantetheinyl transferase